MADAIVVGAGHNGLVAAWTLAKAGVEVEVFERRHIVGGACTTEPLGHGFRCSTSAYVASVLNRPIVAEMELARHGLELLPGGSLFNPFPDHSALYLSGDEAEDRASISQFSRADAEAYPLYLQALAPVLAFVEAQQHVLPPDLAKPGVSDVAGALTTQRAFRRLGDTGQRLLLKAMTASAVDFVSEFFESDRMVAAFAAGGTSGVAGSVHTPGSALPLVHFAAGGSSDEGAWALAKGGMGSVTEAMASACREAGVSIQTNAEVAEIEVTSGRVSGVRLEGGRRVQAALVLSNAAAQTTLLGLLDEGALDVGFRRAVSAIRSTGNMGKLNLALTDRPVFRANPDGHHHLEGAIQIFGQGTHSLEAAYRDFTERRPSKHCHFDMLVQSLVDRSLAPSGGEVLTASVKYLPRLIEGREWREDDRRRLLERLIETLGHYAPNLPGAIEHAQLLTPADYELDFGLPGGSVTHADMDLGQLFSARPLLGWARYRTPVSGLYLCGAATHPGGGVSGVCGRNAARQVLRDQRRRSWRRLARVG